MRANEPCWCGSGQKWKKCHRNREQEPQPNYFAETSKFWKAFDNGICLHPLAPTGCSKGLIKAHTIQRSGALNSIAEDEHVYWAKEAVHRLHQNNGKLVPQRVGVREASTFRGFCNKHDTEIFAPIEKQDVKLSRETALLLMFRAVSLEIHQKRSAIKSFQNLVRPDAGMSLSQQIDVQNILAAFAHGMELGLRDLERFKKDADRILISGDFSEMNLAFVEFDGVLPVMASGAFQPEWDFQGERLQDLADANLQQAAMTLTSINGKTVAAICWVGKDSDKIEKFAESFLAINDADKATAIGEACFLLTENTVINPSFWEGLSIQEKDGVSRLMQFGMVNDNNVHTKNIFAIVNSPFRLDYPVRSKALLHATSSCWN